MKKSNLYLIAALIWGIPGIIISIKGIRAYMSMDTDNLWWLLQHYVLSITEKVYEL